MCKLNYTVIIVKFKLVYVTINKKYFKLPLDRLDNYEKKMSTEEMVQRENHKSRIYQVFKRLQKMVFTEIIISLLI